MLLVKLKLLYMKIHYRFLRFRAWLRNRNYNLFVENNKSSQTQLLAYKVVRRSILNNSAELLIAPISNMYYVNLDNLNIRILDTRVQIVNGKYYYDIHLSEKMMADLIKVFNRKVESKTHSVEDVITANTNKSLEFIYNDIRNETTASNTSIRF